MLILLLAGLLLAYMLQRYIYEKFWDRNLDVDVTFDDAYVYEGDSSCLKEVISNDKKLPLPALEVRLAMSRNLEFSKEAKDNSNVSDQTYRRDMFSFLIHQRVIRTLPFVCRKRGFYQITKSEVVGYDFLLTHSYYLEQHQATQMYVYPAQVDVRRLKLLCQAVSGMILVQNRLYPDPFEFSGIREYHPTDPMNHVNWKASARSDELMVNQFDSTTNVSATLVLDVEDRGILKYEPLVEESIRILSSLAAKLVKSQMECDIISNAVCRLREMGQTETELRMHLKAGSNKMGELNRRLACIDLSSDTRGIENVMETKKPGSQTGHIYVLISKNQDEKVCNFVRNLAGSGGQVLWVMPVHPDMEQNELHLPQVKQFVWKVKR